MSRLPKQPSGLPTSSLPGPGGRRRSSAGAAQKSTSILKGLTPEQEALLQEAMEKYSPAALAKSNETTSISQSVSSLPITPSSHSNNPPKKPGLRKQSFSRMTRPSLPSITDTPDTSDNFMKKSHTETAPSLLATKLYQANSGTQSQNIPSQLQRSQNITHNTPGSNLSSSITPINPRLQSIATPQRPVSPSLQLYSVGERVSVESMNIIGTLQFLGPIDIKPGTWAGIELDVPGTGKNDGSINGKQYFSCPPKSGIFVLASKLSKSVDTIDSNSSKIGVATSLPQIPSTAKTNHSIPRPPSASSNSSDKMSSGAHATTLMKNTIMTKNAQNAAAAASRITAGSRASKYIGVTASQLKQRALVKPSNIITTPAVIDSANSHEISQQQKTKQNLGLKRPGSYGNSKSPTPSFNSNNNRSRRGSDASNESAISNISQSGNYHKSGLPRSRATTPNQTLDSQSPSDTETTVSTPLAHEEMSNKSLQEKIQKLLSDPEPIKGHPIGLFDEQDLQIKKLQMKIEVLETENTNLRLEKEKIQAKSGKLDVSNGRVLNGNIEINSNWEIEKKNLLEAKELTEKTLNEKIEQLTKQLEDASKGHHPRPSTSLSMIADNDLMNDKILSLTELVEQKDEQMKVLEESLRKANADSAEYKSKVSELEKLNDKRTEEIEQLIAKSKTSEITIQEQLNEIGQLNEKLNRIQSDSENKVRSLQETATQVQVDSESKVSSLQESVVELKNAGKEAIKIYEIRVTALEKQIEDLKKAGIETLTCLEESNAKITQRDSRIKFLEKECEELRLAGVEAIHVYEKMLEIKDKEIKDAEATLSKKEAALEAAKKVKQELSSMQVELNETRSRLNDANDKLDLKEKSMEGLRKELADLQSCLEQLMRADAKSRENIYQLEDEVRESKSFIARQQEEIAALKNNVQQLMDSKDNQEVENVKAVYESDINRLQDELEEVRKTLSEVQSEKRSIVGDLDVLLNDKKLLEQKIKEHEREKKEADDELDLTRVQLKSKIEELKETVNKNGDIIKESEKEKAELIEARELAEKTLAETQANTGKELSELREQLEKLQTQANLANQLKSELEEKMEELKKLNEKFEEHKQNAENTKPVEAPMTDSQEFDELKTNYENRIEEYQSEIVKLKQKIKDLVVITKAAEALKQCNQEYEQKFAKYEEQFNGLTVIVKELTEENVKLSSANKKILIEQEHFMEAHRQAENECMKLMDELERLHSESLGTQGILSLSPPAEDTYDNNGAINQETTEDNDNTTNSTVDGQPATEVKRLQSLLVEKQTQIDHLTTLRNVEIRELHQKISELEKVRQREVSTLNKEVAELESLIESKIFREADLEEQIERERSVSKKLRSELEDMKEQLRDLTNLEKSFGLDFEYEGVVKGGTGKEEKEEKGTPKLYCEICEKEGHDVLSCKAVVQSSGENEDMLNIKDAAFNSDTKDGGKPYCDNCEEYGLHWTDDCPNQDETF
ncbi:8303_t:CDS:2 [Acaulospora morrowiae]|uniref:8303_t:CDS:1 n=1 Tax=Acaulospora morrowiae TaxID=94023 RepID=A0A9N8WMZ1_9GLOM|nr:8303_t:CDS:2 [Acaulospora morrowiae]